MSVQSHNHEFVAFEVTVKEFYDYRLYYDMIDDVKIANGTYVSYRNIIYNYINPKIGNMKINCVRRDTLIEVRPRPLPDFVIEECMIFFRLSHQKLMYC